MILRDEYTKQCREETATDRGQAIRKKRDVRFTMWKIDEVTKGGDPVENILLGLSFGSQVKEQMQPPQSLICPTPAPALGQGVWWDVWSCLKKAMMKRGEMKQWPQHLEDSGVLEGAQTGTLELCAPWTALFARGAHVWESRHLNCLTVHAHVSTNPWLLQWLSVFISLYLGPVVSLSLSLGRVLYRLWGTQVRSDRHSAL